MIELDDLEREIGLFHENVQNSNHLMNALQDAVQAMRVQTDAAQNILAHTDQYAIQIPQQVEERLQTLRTQFNAELNDAFSENKSVLHSETEKAVKALKQYNLETKASHEEMQNLYHALTEIEERWNAMIRQQVQTALVSSTADIHQQFDAVAQKISAVLQTYQQTEQERMLSVLQAQTEQNTAAQQQFQAASAQIQSASDSMLRMMHDLEQHQQSLSSEFQSMKHEIADLKAQFSSLSSQTGELQSRFKKYFLILFIVTVMILLCTLGSLALHAMR